MRLDINQCMERSELQILLNNIQDGLEKLQRARFRAGILPKEFLGEKEKGKERGEGEYCSVPCMIIRR